MTADSGLRWTRQDDALRILAGMTDAQREATIRDWVDHGGWRATRWIRAMFAGHIRRRVEAGLRAPEDRG